MVYSLFLYYSAGWVHADEGVFQGLHHVRLEVWSKGEGQQKVKAAGKELTVSKKQLSFIASKPIFRNFKSSSAQTFCSVLKAS